MSDEPKPTTLPAQPAKQGLSSSLKIAIVFTLLAGGIVGMLLMSDAGDALSYSKLVDEVVDHPDRFEGRQLRVEGQLRQGTIRFREDPCEWRFVIERGGRQLPVSFPQCVVPDTFRDGFGIQVTVKGHLQDDRSFLANEVIPRCPSKYEMEQRQRNGETMPHSASSPPREPG